MEVRLLGPVELVGDDGLVVALGGPKERALLAVLACHEGQVLSEDRLIDSLWGDVAPRTAGRTLQSYLSRLRKAIGEASPDGAASVQSTPGGCLLRLGSEALDVARVEAMADRARAASERGDHLAAALAFADALRVWRGRPLEEFADHPWAVLEAGRLEELHQTVAEQRADAELACGRHAELVGELEALCRSHPLRERPWAQRMLALYRSGRQAEALRVYQELRRTLSEELGIDPSPALASLEQQILLQDPVLEWRSTVPARPDTAAAMLDGEPEATATFAGPFPESPVVTVLAADLPVDLANGQDLVNRLGETVTSCGGVELDAGDCLLSAAFRSAVDAVSCAAAMQQQVARARRRQHQPDLQLRVGLHTGDMSGRGDPTAVAQHLCLSAGPGQILVSRAVSDLVGSRGGYEFEDWGPIELDDSRLPVSARIVKWAEHAESPLPAALAPLAEVSFVGRDAEIKTIDRAWQLARDGRRQVTLIAGEPGIGKTTLAARVAAAAREHGGAVLFGRCDEESLVSFQPFVEAIGSYVNTAGPGELRVLLGAQAADLALLVPGLGHRLPEVANVVGTGVETERYRIFEAVVTFFTALGEQGPIVLVLDDLHWADRPTLGLWQHLIRRSNDIPLLMLGTYRDTDLVRTHPMAETLVDLRRADLVARVLLRGLSASDVLSLVTGGQLAQPGDRQLADELWEETEGSPLFLREILRHLEETGAAFRDSTGRWNPRRRLDQLGIPEGVKEVIGRRLSRLSDAANVALRAGSVLGRQIRLDVLERVTDLTTDQLLDAMEEAVAAGVIDEVPAVMGRWTFTHALVRQALYEELSLSRRVRLHQRIGEALELLEPEDGPLLAELAYHFAQSAVSGTAEKAIAYAWQAGEHALSLAAYEQAARHFAMALEVAEDTGTDVQLQADLVLAQGDAEMRAGDARIARPTLERVVRLIGTTDPERLGRAALSYAAAGIKPAWVEMFVVNERAVQLLETALEALSEDDSELRARLLACLAQELYFDLGSERRGDELSASAVAMARRLGDPQTLAYVLCARNLAIARPDLADEVRANATEMLALAERLDDRQLEAHALRQRLIYCPADELPTIHEDIRRWETLTEQLKDPAAVWVDRWLRGLVTTIEGRFDEAEEYIEAAFRLGHEINDRNTFGAAGTTLAFLRFYQGRVAEVLTPVRVAKEFYPVGASWADSVIAGFYAELGRDADAKACADGVDPADPRSLPRNLMWSLAMTGLARAAYRLRDEGKAEVVYRLLEPYADHYGIAITLGTGSLHLPLAWSASTAGLRDEARGHFEEALTVNRGSGWRPAIAETQLHYAKFLLEVDPGTERDRALQLLGEAIATAEELGMPAIGAEAIAARDQLLGRTIPAVTGRRERTVSRRDRARAKLTSRGRAVVARWTRGETDDQLIGRFSSPVAQKALLGAMARSFQPAMALGFAGDLVFELRPPDDELDPAAADWWTIEIRGRKASARRGRSDSPAVTVHQGLADFIRGASGELHPVQALIENRIRIEGDFMLAARLPDMFGAVEPVEGLTQPAVP